MTDQAAQPVADKRMRLRYAGTCRLCGAGLPAHAVAVYERSTKTVRCVECPDDAPPGDTPVDEATTGLKVGLSADGAGFSERTCSSGVAGSSARREYERRQAKDEARLRARWGRLGGLAVALADERQSTRAWQEGAVGEEVLGRRLDALASDDIGVLHDRRIPGSRANMDHLVITRSGVWVVDAERYQGRPELKVDGGLLRPRVERLLVDRRDRTQLVDGVLRQTEVVTERLGDVPVIGALCFVEADWPLVGGTFTTRGVHVLWPKRLATLLRDASHGEVDVVSTRAVTAAAFPPA